MSTPRRDWPRSIGTPTMHSDGFTVDLLLGQGADSTRWTHGSPAGGRLRRSRPVDGVKRRAGGRTPRNSSIQHPLSEEVDEFSGETGYSHSRSECPVSSRSTRTSWRSRALTRRNRELLAEAVGFAAATRYSVGKPSVFLENRSPSARCSGFGRLLLREAPALGFRRPRGVCSPFERKLSGSRGKERLP